MWSRLLGSNQRPELYESPALSTVLRRQKELVGMKGLKPLPRNRDQHLKLACLSISPHSQNQPEMVVSEGIEPPSMDYDSTVLKPLN